MRDSLRAFSAAIKQALQLLLAAMALGGALSGCVSTQGVAAKHSPLTGVVAQYFDALNRRDLLALAAYVTPDVEWYSIVAGERILEVSGREPLTQALQGYFDATKRTHWAIKSVQSVANTIAIVERSEWSEAQGTQARDSIAVYEFVDGRIRRMTHYLNSKQ